MELTHKSRVSNRFWYIAIKMWVATNFKRKVIFFVVNTSPKFVSIIFDLDTTEVCV
jgi:hypothetical protein